MEGILQVSADQRGRLAISTERLNQSSDRIKESRRTVFETEELGVSILQDLHQQRETLLHSHTKVLVAHFKFPIITFFPSVYIESSLQLSLCTLTFFLCVDWWALLHLSTLQLHGVDDAIDKSKKILGAMSKRMSRNKWIVGSVIAALVLAIIFILYLKLSHN